MTTYLQVTGKFDGRKRTFRLAVTNDTPKLLSGWQVDKEGGYVEKGENGNTRVFVVVSAEDIIKRIPLRMNLHYGELEPIKEG